MYPRAISGSICDCIIFKLIKTSIMKDKPNVSTAFENLKDSLDEMKKQKKRRLPYLIFGAVVGISAFALMFIWYDWKLALITFLVLWGNNISQK